LVSPGEERSGEIGEKNGAEESGERKRGGETAAHTDRREREKTRTGTKKGTGGCNVMKKIKRVISADPLFVRDVGDTYTREQIDAMVSALQTGKYNKIGGDIEGDAKVKGVLTLDIDDEEFNDMIADEGEIIDYEELKSSSADDINLEKPEEDDDDDDSVIEMDVLKLLSGEDENENSENNESEGENKPEGEKNEKKTLIQKFKFVKKV
jgi:hypothetical protein